MNDLIQQLLMNPKKAQIIQQKLPPAFLTVENELKGNPAVGLLREQVIIGMLIALLDENIVEIAESGVNPDIDCYINSDALSIKTISYKGAIRLKWTSNAVKAEQFMENYQPNSDILVVRIFWGQVGEVRLIPLAVQQLIFSQLGVEQYLSYSGNTNTRGVNLSLKAESMLNIQPDSISLPIPWECSNTAINPIDKWIDYWRS